MPKSLYAVLPLLLAIGSFNANAQTFDRRVEQATPSKSASNDPMAVTREMSNRLQLNESQFLKLLPLNRTRISGMNSINHMYKKDEATRTQKLMELESQFEQECSRILTPSQLSQLQQKEQQPTTAPASTGNGLG